MGHVDNKLQTFFFFYKQLIGGLLGQVSANHSSWYCGKQRKSEITSPEHSSVLPSGLSGSSLTANDI